jgi:hypothetical protein
VCFWSVGCVAGPGKKLLMAQFLSICGAITVTFSDRQPMW